jgi:hypothetical protein
MCYNGGAIAFNVDGYTQAFLIDDYEQEVNYKGYMQESILCSASDVDFWGDWYITIVHSKPAQVTIAYTRHPGFSYNFYSNDLPMVKVSGRHPFNERDYLDSFYSAKELAYRQSIEPKIIIKYNVDSEMACFNKIINPPSIRCNAKASSKGLWYLSSIGDVPVPLGHKLISGYATFNVDTAGLVYEVVNINIEADIKQAKMDKIKQAVTSNLLSCPYWMPSKKITQQEVAGARIEKDTANNCICTFWIRTKQE